MLAGILAPSFFAGAEDGGFAWAKAMGGPKYDVVSGMVLDDSGNIYTTGYFRNIMDFDPNAGVFELDAGSQDDIFVSKMDNAGNLVWAVSMGGASNDAGHAIALDEAGNVYITGSFYGVADFDPGPGLFELDSPNGSGAFVVKLDNSGNFLWAVAFTGPAGLQGGAGIAVDNEGNVYTTGGFYVYCDFDPGPGVFEMTSIYSTFDIYVSKLDTDGNFVWAKAFNGDGSVDNARGIALDDAGHVYTTGEFGGYTMDFDPGPEVFALHATATRNSYVSELDNDGNFVWAAEFGKGSGRSVTVDSTGNLYSLGLFDDMVDFDPGPGVFELTATDSHDDIYVVKLDRESNFVWAIQMGGNGDVDPLDFTVDDKENIYITGSFEGSADFDPGPELAELTCLGWGKDTFIAKLDAAGNLIWLKHIGGIYANYGQCIEVDAAENSFAAGIFNTVDFNLGSDSFELVSAGEMDVFVTKLYGPPPRVVSIMPTQSTPTEGGLLVFIVTFSTEVNGVNASDFLLTTTGSLSNPEIIHVTGAGTTYTVIVAGAEGSGTLRLDLIDDDSITDEAGTPLGGIGTGNADFTAGDAYTIVPELPVGILPLVLVLLSILGMYGLYRTRRKRYKER